MDRQIKRFNDILVNLFNTVLRLEEKAIKDASFDDISITEVHTLQAIGTGRPKTMTHIANILGIAVSTLTTAIGRLVKKGYVQRMRDTRDRRIVKIRLTERGGMVVREHERFHEAMIRESISQIPEDDVKRFVSSIDNINNFLIMRSNMAYVKDFSVDIKPLKLAAGTLPVPIVQAGMSIGIAGAGLAAAVASQGGLGLIGTSEIGYHEEGYDEDPLGVNLRVIEREVSKACREAERAGAKGMIGANIMWTHKDAGRYVEAAVRGGAQVIVTSGGIPKDLPAYCSDRKISLIPTISSAKAVRTISKSWDSKYGITPDGFIFQSPVAAGILGFRESELEKATADRYRLIAEIKSEISRMEHCVLIAGGGIVDRKDAEKVCRYGADGVMMGTRFVTTKECGVSDEYKKLYLNCSANDVTIVRSPMNTSVRVMKNRFSEMLAATGIDDYDMAGAVKLGIDGDFDRGLMFCSASADRISRIETVEDVFREFTT